MLVCIVSYFTAERWYYVFSHLSTLSTHFAPTIPETSSITLGTLLPVTSFSLKQKYSMTLFLERLTTAERKQQGGDDITSMTHI